MAEPHRPWEVCGTYDHDALGLPPLPKDIIVRRPWAYDRPSLMEVMGIPDFGGAELTSDLLDATPHAKCTGTFDAESGHCDSCAAIDYERRGCRHE